MGNITATAIKKAGGPSYRVGSASDILYAASGASDDYAKSVGVEYVYTMELTNSGYGFALPTWMIEGTARPLVEGIVTMMGEVAKTVQSQGGDSQ